MLRNTFQHIPGIGPKIEHQLWASEVLSWEDLRVRHPASPLLKRTKKIEPYLSVSRKELDAHNPDYFAERLPAHQHWRLFPEFRSRLAYLDIETDGLDPYYGAITTIALYDGDTVFTFVKDHNLEDFTEIIPSYRVIATYNGKCFDVPFIETHLGIKLDQAHIDLRYVLAALGYKGGLKACEMALGLKRDDVQGVDGFFAVLLWQDYLMHHNVKALETLLAYNIYDAVNLETLMVIAYNQHLAGTPFAKTHRLPLPPVPDIPYQADRNTIERIKRRIWVGGDWHQQG